MYVIKFGGSSIADAQRIVNVIGLIEKTRATYGEVAVVVSAFGGVTDELIRISRIAVTGSQNYKEPLKALEERHVSVVRELIPALEQSPVLLQIRMWLNDLEDVLNGIRLVGELSQRCLDYICAFGELLSARIIAEATRARLGVGTFLDAREVVKANYDFGSGKVDFPKTDLLINQVFYKKQDLYIITGFIASTDNNETITLGRGGSDYTASIFGAALNSKEVVIWTDVDGMMTADPRKVKKAFSQKAVTYEEAMELSHFGAKVIFPPTMQPALDKRIPIRVKNTFNPDYEGTLVEKGTKEDTYLATGISSISEVALLRLQGSGMIGAAGVAKRLFATLADAQINIILITQASSEHTICVAVKPEEAAKAKKAIDQELAYEIEHGRIREVAIEGDLSIVSVVGENMRKTPGVAAKVFYSLGRNGVNVIAIAQGSSELNISAVIGRGDERKALNALHEEFFFAETRAINIFLVGTGLIGSALLKQIEDHSHTLQQRHSNEVRIIGLANSRKMLIHPDGLELKNLKENLLDEGAPSLAGIKDFVNEMRRLNIPNSVFVDCTASADIAQLYPEILRASISVVTPNKKAQSAPLPLWEELLQAGRRKGVEFLFETSVGAGLPVISTLNDLLKSGDKITRIEAVLSGTLSYIFNTFGPGKTFSSVVLQAKEKGFTEPDPRDDLNGLDVARKILILSRVSGAKLEINDVEIENLVPPDCRETKDINDFFKRLTAHDAEIERRRQQAENKGAKLCYIATFEHGKASVALKEIDSQHPFYNLSGSDNIISFSTARYSERPLVVKGPGAGAEVTAAGVFADLIRLAN